MKLNKLFAMILSIAILTATLGTAGAIADEKKLSIVTTIFPIHDWVREIAGTEGNADITLLLDSGVDLHSYQPTAADILKIATCDVFVYVGGESEAWVEDVLKDAINPNMVVINLLECLGEDVKMEELVEGMQHEHDEDHEEDHEHHGEDHEHEGDHGEEDHEHDHEHEEEADEHVWLSLRNAQKLVTAITVRLAEADPVHAGIYQANAEAYIEKLSALDAEYTEATEQATYKTILFGDRFPFRYLADDYGLTYYAAFSGCSAETEASFQTIVFLAQKMDELGLPAVLTIEGTNHKIAETIIQTTADKHQKLLTLHSMQGITAADVQAGTSYLAIMQANLDVLKEALK
ncbi:MAG: metal ABC transporter substrate-binding protein [Clostridiales bacterium]|nr:metal ABC transporter substrate-binding protein [Clostridiales bacterium]